MTTYNKDLFEFVSRHTSHFDQSHDIDHALAVYRNAVIIANTDYPIFDDEILQYACMLHDVCDHKYSHSISKEDLHKYILSKLDNHKAKIVIDVIDNISYSQEVKGLRQDLPDVTGIYQNIVSDADKLEALGEVGLRRCIAFTLEKGGKVPEDVIHHCYEKLLKLKDTFIRTPMGKKLASPLHDHIVNYVNGC